MADARAPADALTAKIDCILGPSPWEGIARGLLGRASPPFDDGSIIRQLGRAAVMGTPLDRAVKSIEEVRLALAGAFGAEAPPGFPNNAREFVRFAVHVGRYLESLGDDPAPTAFAPVAPALRRIASHLQENGSVLVLVLYLVRSLLHTPDDASELRKLALAVRGLYQEVASLPGALVLFSAFVSIGRRASVLDPGEVDIHYELGVALNDMGRFDEAFLAYSAALDAQEKRRPTAPDTYQNIEILLNGLLLGVGHIAYLDYYIKLQKLGWRPERKLVVLVYSDRPFNREFLDYWRRYVTLVEEPQQIAALQPYANILDVKINAVIEAKGKRAWCHHIMADAQKAWEEEGRPPLIALKPSDYIRGWDALERVGLKRGDWFVCVHVREGGFKDEKLRYSANADIGTFLPAMRHIVERGGWVLRMGDPSMSMLPKMDGVIDYANSELRSEWMDIFCCAQCRFYLGTSSGLIHVPFAFHIPSIATNWTPISARPYGGRDLFIPKLYRSSRNERLLGFAEAWQPPLGQCYNANVFAAQGVELVDNTEDEIFGVVTEMMQRLDGSFQATGEDQELQRRFDAIAVSHASRYGSYGLNSRIGRDFLRGHSDLL
ncbi:MAG: TIGR04372 family glycosyltransferase [Proteobacteria bacterium]|nr:TIGR04372 family glycosyltransferase [Pseudomonadota bacterium]